MYQGFVVKALILPQGSYRPGDPIELSDVSERHMNLIRTLRRNGVISDRDPSGGGSRRGTERGVGV